MTCESLFQCTCQSLQVNTCPHQPLFKKILIDRINPRSGIAIHNGLRFVAACNPWRRASRGTVVSVGFESPVSADDRLAGLAYRVHISMDSQNGLPAYSDVGGTAIRACSD